MKMGSRFSAKAAIASCVSRVEKFRAWHRASSSTACSIDAMEEAASSVLVMDRAKGGPAARVVAQSSTKSSSWSTGSTLFTRPMAAASSPLHMLPKSAISLARAKPTSRGSSQDAPLSSARPRLAKIMESLARSLQTTRSQPSARDNPAPTAKPSTLAMVGMETWCRARATSPRRRMRARPDRVGSVAGPLGSERSAPEQKAPPAPVSTITLSSGLSSTSSKVLRSSVSILPLAAFLRSGRFIVTVTTPSLRSTISVSIGTDPNGWGRTASERTFDDVERPVEHAGHVEADLGPVPVLALQVERGQPAQPELLRPGDRLERVAAAGPGPGLDLADDQGGAAG